MLIFLILGYFLGLLLVIVFKNRSLFHAMPYPKLKLCKYGLKFNSTKRHRIYVGECKIMQLNNQVYLKKSGRVVVLKNVDKIATKCGYLYFTALGEVRIIFNAKQFYKYFNLKIISKNFDLEKIKDSALISLTDYIFNPERSEKLSRYLNILINILKIKIIDGRLSIKRNKFNLKYQLKYVRRNRIMTINVS